MLTIIGNEIASGIQNRRGAARGRRTGEEAPPLLAQRVGLGLPLHRALDRLLERPAQRRVLFAARLQKIPTLVSHQVSILMHLCHYRPDSVPPTVVDS